MKKDLFAFSYTEFFKTLHLVQKEKLLSWANNPFDFKQKVLGRNLSTFEEQMGRLILIQKLAVDAEIANKWKTADFFFAKFFRIFEKKYYNDTSFWENYIQTFQLEVTPAEVKNEFVKGILAYLHFTFFSAYKTRKKKVFQERARLHSDYIAKIVERFLLEEQKQDLLFDIDTFLLQNELNNPKNHAFVLNICEKRITPDLDDEYSRYLIEYYFQNSIDKVKKKNQWDKVQNLNRSIGKLESLRKQAPLTNILYQRLAVLNYYLAIEQANQHKLAEALQTIEKAVCYNPYIRDLTMLREQLIQMMKQMTAQINQVVRNLPYNHYLTPEGKHSLSQSKIGFSLMNTYSKSSLAKEIQESRELAYFTHLWKKIKPDQSEEDPDWHSKAILADRAINRMISEKITEDAEIIRAWENSINSFPELVGIAPSKVLAYFQEIQHPETSQPVKLSISPQYRFFLNEVPAYIPTEKKVLFKDIPFDFWLASKKNLVVKSVAVLALLFFVCTLLVSANENIKKGRRDKAYMNILGHIRNDAEFETTVVDLRRYLKNDPWFYQDQRRPFVQNFYEAAFSEWFLGQLDKENPDLEKYARQFQSLQ